MSQERERQVFDPESIRTALDRNLPEGLRAIADAIEVGDVDGRLNFCGGHGFTSRDDTRAHVAISLDLAAEVFRWVGSKRVVLDEPPTLYLPRPSAKQITQGGEQL